MEELNNHHELMRNKPRSMITIYRIFDVKNNKPFKIENKEIYLCIQQSRGSRQNSISSLSKPKNVINPTNKHRYSHNEDQGISKSIESLSMDLD